MNTYGNGTTVEFSNEKGEKLRGKIEWRSGDDSHPDKLKYWVRVEGYKSPLTVPHSKATVIGRVK